VSEKKVVRMRWSALKAGACGRQFHLRDAAEIARLTKWVEGRVRFVELRVERCGKKRTKLRDIPP